MLAIGQLCHQSATAPSLATHAADAVAAHQCHESDGDSDGDSDVIFTSRVTGPSFPFPDVYNY